MCHEITLYMALDTNGTTSEIMLRPQYHYTCILHTCVTVHAYLQIVVEIMVWFQYQSEHIITQNGNEHMTTTTTNIITQYIHYHTIYLYSNYHTEEDNSNIYNI